MFSILQKKRGSSAILGRFDGKIHFRDMPQAFKDEFLKVDNNPEALLNMFDKDVQRMKVCNDWADEQIQSIKATALIVNGDADLGSSEHAVEMYRMLPNAQLSILPDGHGSYPGEITTGMENSKLPDLAEWVQERNLTD